MCLLDFLTISHFRHNLAVLILTLSFLLLTNSEKACGSQKSNKSPTTISNIKNLTSKTFTPQLTRQPLIISVMKHNAPFTMELKNGEMTGLYVDFWRLWSKYNDREITFKASDFLENLEDLREGRVDFHSGLSTSIERESWADFSIPIHHVNTGVYFYEKLQKPKKMSELSGKTLAVNEGSVQSIYVKNNFPQINTVTFVDDKKMLKQLLNGEIDGIVAEEPFIDSLLSSFGIKGILTKSDEILLSNEAFALIPKGNKKLVDELNKGIKNIPIDKIVALEKQWLPNYEPYFSNYLNKKIPSLNLRETEIIENLGELTLGSDPDWEPIEFIGENGTLQGISADYLSYLQETIGLQIKQNERHRWETMLKKAKNQSIDLITAITKTKKRAEYLKFTIPYLSFPVVILTREQPELISSLESVGDKRLALVGDGSLEELLKDNHPELSYQKIDNILLALKQLKDNKIDVFIGNYFLIKHYLEDSSIEGIKVSGFTPYTIDISMAVSENRAHLVPILNKSLSQITSRERLYILNKWRREEVKVDDQWIIFLYWAVPVSSLFLLVFLYVSLVNQRMLKEIKERKKTEIRLMQERIFADEANNVKDEFLANMSHELRTPMNSVVGMSQLLKMTNMSCEQIDYVTTINESSKKLLNLINDILDLSKMDAGKFLLESIPVKLEKLVNQVVLLERKYTELQIEVCFSNRIPPFVLADPLRVSQILHKLVNNAVKFTEKGLIKVSVVLLDEKKSINNNNLEMKNKTEICFYIEDTGIGMNGEQVEHIFRSYNQVDASNTRRYGGAGLGLKLCKKLCNLMDGNIEVKSEGGKGTQFLVTLPFLQMDGDEYVGISSTQISTEKMAIQGVLSNRLENKFILQADELLAENKRKLKNRRVLVVDDNQVNLIVAKKLLEKNGLSVTTADSGASSIELLASHKFDIILMDIQMPIMNGYEATIKIKQKEGMNKTPIVALTASIGKDEIESIKKCGMQGVVDKPIDINQLFKTLADLLFKVEQ